MQATGQGSGGGGASQAAATYRTLRSRHGGVVLGDINVTPLVDVVLVLLLVFMVTAPMLSRGVDEIGVGYELPSDARKGWEWRVDERSGRPRARAARGDAPRLPGRDPPLRRVPSSPGRRRGGSGLARTERAAAAGRRRNCDPA